MTALPKAWLSWSTGKDSAWTLEALRHDRQVEVTALLTTVNTTHGRVAMHAVREDLLRRQADAAGLPLVVVPLPWPCPNSAYEEAMAQAVANARNQSVTHMAFGDLFLSDVRRYREERLRGSGITPIFPLWGKDTFALAREMLAAGLRARLTCIDPRKLDSSFAGRLFDDSLLTALPASVDPCGENGEFHTFCFEAPVFREPISVRAAGTIERDGFIFTDLLDNAVADSGSERIDSGAAS